MWKTRVAEAWILVNRGKGHLNFLKELFLLAAGLKVLELPLMLIPILLVLGYVLFWLVGYIDMKFGFWKFENDYSYQHLNPYLNDLLKKRQDSHSKSS